MFNITHVQAIYLYMFIKFLQKNLTAVNKAINSYKDDPYIFMIGEYLTVKISHRGDVINGEYGISFSAFGEDHFFKLAKGDDPHFNKRALNDIQVWFHRAGRPILEEAIEMITARVKQIDLRPRVKAIGLWDRLLARQLEAQVDYQSMIINALIPTRVVIQRNIFNKLNVFVDVSTPAPEGTATDKMPVHFGVLRSYEANKETDPVNRWFHEAILEHVENNLK